MLTTCDHPATPTRLTADDQKLVSALVSRERASGPSGLERSDHRLHCAGRFLVRLPLTGPTTKLRNTGQYLCGCPRDGSRALRPRGLASVEQSAHNKT